MKVLYNTIEIPVPTSLAKLLTKNKGLFSMIIIGLISLIVFLTLCLCMYAARYKFIFHICSYNKTKKILNYELQDVRNIIGSKVT